MAGKFNPKNAVRAIYTHYELLSAACLRNSGAISDTEDKKTLDELYSQKLLTVIDDNHEYRMNSKVRALIDHLEGHFRFRQRHGEIEEIIDDLKEAVEKYNRIYHKGDLRAKSRAFSEVNDYGADLIDELQDNIYAFYHLVDEDYSIVSDIDEKLRQMERCQKELEKINEIYSRLTVGRLEEEFISDDPLINRLIFKSLSRRIAEGLNEISILSSKIVSRMSSLQNQKQLLKRNHLIDTFVELYTDRPDFKPDIDSYWITPKLAIAEPMELAFTPELTESSSDIPDYYRKFAAETLKEAPKIAVRPDPDKGPEVRDARDSTFRLDKSIIEKHVDYFMQAVLSDKVTREISALQGYHLLKIEDIKISPEDWMYIVLIGYQELPSDISQKIIMEPVLVNYHPTFTGNQFFSDLIFRKRLNSDRI